MATPSLRYVAPPGNSQPNLDPEPVVIFGVPGATATVAALPATLGTAGQALRVNTAGTALEWYTPTP